MKFQVYGKIFDFTQNKFSIDGKIIDLSNNAEKGLLLFLESQNTILSKDSLMKGIWGDLVVSDDSLFKVIQSIRKLFKKIGIKENVLINVYGKGYKIIPSIEVLDSDKTIINLEDKTFTSENRPKKNQNKLVIPFLMLAVVVLSIYFVRFSPFSASSKSIIDNKTYIRYKQNAISQPQKILQDLEKKYIGKLKNKNDKINYYTLVGLALFAQGKYQESIESFNTSIGFDDESPNLAIADAYHQLAVINLYRSKPDAIIKNLKPALKYYKELNNLPALYDAQRALIDYNILIKDYKNALKTTTQLIAESRENGKYFALMRAYAAKYFLHDTLNEREEKLKALNDLSEVAEKTGNAFYILLAYGELALFDLEQGNYLKAMIKINKTLPYTLSLKNTNQFQQGFSYLYNSLSELGHDDLAEKYLTLAIAVQNKFNSEGHLVLAETNLAILYYKLEKFRQADVLLSKIIGYNNLSQLEIGTVKAWKALSKYRLKDSISAFALAKEVYDNPASQSKAKFIAAIALVYSAIDLEKYTQAEDVMKQVDELANPIWLLEYPIYLKLALFYYKDKSPEKYQHYFQLKNKFEQNLINIKNQTKPDAIRLEELDAYIQKIL